MNVCVLCVCSSTGRGSVCMCLVVQDVAVYACVRAACVCSGTGRGSVLMSSCFICVLWYRT